MFDKRLKHFVLHGFVMHYLDKLRLAIIFSYRKGAVLVFLPGYDEIITLRDTLIAHKEFGNSKRYCYVNCQD